MATAVLGRAGRCTDHDGHVLELPAEPAALRALGPWVRSALAALGVGGLAEREGVARRIELAVHELAVNAIHHGYGGPDPRARVRVLVAGGPQVVEVRVDDDAPPFAPPAPLPPPDALDPRSGGYGLLLVRGVADSVDHGTCGGGGNRWSLRFSTAATAQPTSGP